MKRIILILAVLSFFAGAYSQNVDDAVRYSQIFYGGTARSSAMGGAFTALGGDASTLGQNPAGIGVFRTSEITITPQFFFNKTTSSFSNNPVSSQLNNFNIGQFGLVANVSKKNSGLMSLNIGYSFYKANYFNQNAVIDGRSNSSSMADYWAALGNRDGGTFYKDLGGAEGIAFDAWIIDTVAGSGGRRYGTVFSNYGDNPTSTYGQSVRRTIYNDGYKGDNSISIGGNYSNKLYFGATLGISTIRYSSHYEHIESTNVPLASAFSNFDYTDHYEDKGTGYSVKLGLIYRPVETVRLGLAFHSPTWYKIDEYYYTDITSKFTNGNHFEFSNDPMRFNYALATPYRLLAGVGVQIRKIALVSADYEYVDYSAAKFSETGDGYDYSGKNQAITESLKPASNFRLGAEVRLDKFYLRGGFGYYGKAFKAGQDNENYDYTTISGGAGFRDRSFSIDFGFTNYNYSQNYVLYPVETGNPAMSGLKSANNILTVTLGYKMGM